MPNDPYLASGSLWGLTRIAAPAAWDVTQGQGVVVAIVDTGIKAKHRDLTANMWTNPGETPRNRVDDDGNGFVDDVEDGSSLRRGLPVAHSIFGVPQTINSANYIYFVALRELARLPNNPARAVDIFSDELVNLHRGQGDDDQERQHEGELDRSLAGLARPPPPHPTRDTRSSNTASSRAPTRLPRRAQAATSRAMARAPNPPSPKAASGFQRPARRTDRGSATVTNHPGALDRWR